MSEIGRATSVGRRVVVTGMAGAGKSAFSQALGARTGLPVIHLDLHRWKPGWVRKPDDEFREKQRGLLAGQEWIVDGDAALDLRLERADTVVFLDTSWWICAGRAFMRGLRRPPGFSHPTAARTPPGDGCETNGGWSGASGEPAARSESANWQTFPYMGGTPPCTCSAPSGPPVSFSTAWTTPSLGLGILGAQGWFHEHE